MLEEYIKVITANDWFAFITGAISIISFIMGFFTHKLTQNKANAINVASGKNSTITSHQTITESNKHHEESEKKKSSIKAKNMASGKGSRIDNNQKIR